MDADMNGHLPFTCITAIAERIGVDPCALWAVCQVESSGNGFLPDRRPKILFEGHVFWRELEKRGINPARFTVEYPSLVYKSWTRAYYQGGSKEYSRLDQAAGIHKDAALCSTSWGMFQIMGFNYLACGYADVQSFVRAMHVGAEQHLEAVCQLLATHKILPFLQGRNWPEFSKRYNGSGYAQHKYDTKLEQAYNRCKGDTL